MMDEPPRVSAHVDVTDATFETEVVERSRELPVVVDFWADWCGPCRALTPVLEQEVDSRNGAVALAKIDVDANPSLSAAYRVQGIPAVKAFKDGRVVSEFVGARSPVAVAAFFDELLAPPAVEGLLEELRASGDLPELLSALEAGDRACALDAVLAEIADATPERRERLRQIAVAVFQDLGQDDPTTVAYRRRLAAALY
jgi:putative thioredoxin